MKSYFSGHSLVSLRNFIYQLDILPAVSSSTYRSQSVGRSVGWNDPLHAYIAIVNFLAKSLQENEISNTFAITKVVTCKSCINIRSREKNKQKAKFHLN